MDDDIDALMPRTRAAADSARVNVGSLKQYMAASKFAGSDSVGARSGVVVRSDVRKDAQGFEDIDEFWADDDLADKDDDDDESFATEKDQTATDTSTVSSTSEREPRMSAASSMQLSDDEQDESLRSRRRTTGSSRSRRSTRFSSIGIEASRKSFDVRASDDFPADAPNSPPSFDFGNASPIESPVEDNVTMRASKGKGKRRKSSFGVGFDDDAKAPSPFAEPLSPLSDASDRDISVNLSKQFEDDEVTDTKSKMKGSKGKAKATKTTKATSKKGKSDAGKKKKAKSDEKKRPRPTGKYGYKSSSMTDESIQADNMTDGDESFHLTDEDGDATASDDSFYEEKETKVSKRVRRADLRLARDILKGVDLDDENPIALRRSKRKRYKPLAWYKGEHFVYERKHVGVGLVLPTVVGVERSGASSPTKTSRPRTARPPSQRKSLKVLPASELPEGVTYEEGEWADLFDVSVNAVNAMNVICRSNEIRLRKLPEMDSGEPPAFAGQSFNLRNPAAFPRWISGRLVLPPGAAKEPESVGAAVQIFYVTAGQPQALEVAFSPDSEEFFASDKTTRFLLSPGDEFYVPSGNAYYVKNHSKSTDVDLRFTILKPETAAGGTGSAKRKREKTESSDEA